MFWEWCGVGRMMSTCNRVLLFLRPADELPLGVLKFGVMRNLLGIFLGFLFLSFKNLFLKVWSKHSTCLFVDGIVVNGHVE